MSVAESGGQPSGRVAIFHPPGPLELGRNPFGKDVANLQLWQAVARHGGYARIDMLGLRAAEPEQLAAALYEPGGARPELGAALLPGSRAPQDAGVVLRGQPDLAELAWMRRRQGADRAYSLVGWIHTLAPPAMRQVIAQTLVAPLQAWDALVCTSPSVRENVEAMFAGWGAHLAERTGGRPPPQPRLPVIPLGVDGPAFARLADRPEARARVRAGLGLAQDDVLVLWVGRLSFFEKAFPQPMFKAVQHARAATGRKVAFVLAGWFPDTVDREHFEAAARAHARDVEVTFVDGNDQERVGELWAGADIFLSLVDNIQETFGITPLEAMAAGLPVVASDWDGYRATVRDGVEGFLIPTLMGGARGGLGAGLVERHLLGLVTYQSYVGAVAQHTAVHIGRCAEALTRLIDNPDLRRRMGAAGRVRVASTYDWPIVGRQVRALTDELAAVRTQSADSPKVIASDPVRGDPFRTFAGFATEALGLDTWLAPTPGVTAADVSARADLALDVAFPGLRSDPRTCAAAFEVIARAGRVQVRDILLAFPIPERRKLELGLSWMAKYGLVDWLA